MSDDMAGQFWISVMLGDLRRLTNLNPSILDITEARKTLTERGQIYNSEKQLLNGVIWELNGKLLRATPQKYTLDRLPAAVRAEYQLICDGVNAKADIRLGIEELDYHRLRSDGLWKSFRELDRKRCIQLTLNILCQQAGLTRWPNHAQLAHAHARSLRRARDEAGKYEMNR